MAEKYEYSAKYKTPLFRGAFVRVIDPEEVKNNDGSVSKIWGLTAIVPKGTDTSSLKAAVIEAAKKLWGDKTESMLKHPKFKSPFKDGGTQVTRDGEPYEGFEAGQTTFKLSTKQRRPGLVDPHVRAIADTEGKTLVDKDMERYEIIQANAIYSGCWFLATFCAQAYDRDDGFGVSLKLENLQLVKQDDRLGGGGGSSAADDFEPVGGGGPATGGDDLANLLS